MHFMLLKRLAEHNVILSYKKKMNFKIKDPFKGLLRSLLNPPLPECKNILKSRSNPRSHTRTFSRIIAVGFLCFCFEDFFFFPFVLFLFYAGYTDLPAPCYGAPVTNM